MGYTHYWSFNVERGRTAELELTYRKAIIECQRVVLAIAKRNRSNFGSSLMSGYSAHSTLGQYGGLSLNGARGDRCEDFTMREHLTQNDTNGFCKTGRGQYDEAVVACLAILKYRLGDAFEVTSDGNYFNWADGVGMAALVLNRAIKVPASIRPPTESRLAVVDSDTREDAR